MDDESAVARIADAIDVGAYPVLSAGALATFLIVGATQMHDFWTIEDPEEKQSEMTQS